MYRRLILREGLLSGVGADTDADADADAGGGGGGTLHSQSSLENAEIPEIRMLPQRTFSTSSLRKKCIDEQIARAADDIRRKIHEMQICLSREENFLNVAETSLIA